MASSSQQVVGCGAGSASPSRRVLLAACAAASVASLYAPTAFSQGSSPWKIGVIVTKTGAAASFGGAQEQAAQAAADRINAAGGIHGRKIELVIKDSKSDPTEAVRVATQLVREDGVIGIFGDTLSSGTLAFLPMPSRAAVPVVTATTASNVTDPASPWYKFAFRSAQTSSVDARITVDLMKKAGYRRVAILYQDDAYGVSGADAFVRLATQAGLEVVDKVAMQAGATDVSAQVLKVRQSNPEAVLINTSTVTLTAASLRALKNAAYAGGVYGAIAVVQRELIQTAGASAEGFTAGALINPDDPRATPRLQALLSPAPIKNHGHLLGAQGVAVLAAGLQKNPADGKALASAIEQAGPIEGYGTAPMVFSPESHDGVSADSLIVVKVIDGKFMTQPR